MNTAIKAIGLTILCGAMAAVHAQSPPAAAPNAPPPGQALAEPAAPAPAPAKSAKPAKASAQAEAGEPRANTSGPAAT